MSTVITDDQIDSCGFRMFSLPEIARTMAMERHPNGGDYIVLGNKSERMMQYGNAVTPPVTRLLLGKVLEVIAGNSFIDLFCGAGGSSIGAELAGAALRLGLNHSPIAIETHSTNFPHADHDCADVSALTTSQIRRYPDSAIMLASPECTNHSLAKGAKRNKPQAASLFDDGPAGDDSQDRSRATMWDVVRFAEQKIIKGCPYEALIIENVVDAYRWGAGDDGGLFAAWRMALTNLGYDSEIVWLNSMFAPPTPQSRDRMYVVFWRKGIRRPDLKVQPPAWCPHCEKLVLGQQIWKRPDRPLLTAKGMPVGARYGVQYLYGCPDCHGIAIPGVFPAATAIDFTIEAPRIGDRKKDLAFNTRERIRRGLTRLADEPFAIRLLQGGVPRPLTLPLVTLTTRHDMAMVMPVAGNTFERTPGNRARDASRQPGDTLHGTLDRAIVVPHSTGGVAKLEHEPVDTQTQMNKTALVMANRANNVPRDPSKAAAPPILTGGSVGIVSLRNNATVKDPREALHTVSAEGNHHAVVVAHYDPGWARRAGELPFGALTCIDSHSLVMPYQSEPHEHRDPVRTVTGRETIALIVPPNNGGAVRLSPTDPLPTQVTTTRVGIVEVGDA